MKVSAEDLTEFSGFEDASRSTMINLAVNNKRLELERLKMKSDRD